MSQVGAWSNIHFYVRKSLNPGEILKSIRCIQKPMSKSTKKQDTTLASDDKFWVDNNAFGAVFRFVDANKSVCKLEHIVS